MNSGSFIRLAALWLPIVVAMAPAWGQTVTGGFSSGTSQYANSGGSASFSVSVNYSGTTLSSLGVSVSLPAGWSYVSASGSNPPSIPPSEGTTGNAEFAYITAPANSASFSFTLNYPAGLTGDQAFSATAYYKSSAPGATQQTLDLGTEVIAEPPPTPVAPAFTTQPSSQSVAAGGSVSFTAAASGTPAPTFQWRKGGSNISGATSATLTLNSVQASDAGSYDVVATNSAGSATSSAATLTVNTAPAITSQPSSATVNQGQNATFSASASGSPAPTFQWRKDGVDISGATNATLTLNSVTTAQAGNYTVVASNSLGSATSNAATLTVNVPPSFTSQPSSQTVTAGANVVFSVDVSGSPAPALQWRRNGVAIAGATSETLSLNSVLATQAGNYDVVATNSAGSSTSAAATLTVNYGPSITRQPVSQSVWVGANASFSVTANGVPAPSYQWRKDGAAISGNASATTATLTLTNVELGHAGSYDVVVSNALGIAGSSAATLTVTTPPEPDPEEPATAPVFTAQPRDVTARIGASVVLQAAVTGSPAPRYQWQKDGVDVAGAVHASLTLSPLQAFDGGAYTLIATNASGTARSQTAVVGIETDLKVEGEASEVGPDIVHPNGNVYDQILLTGASAVITADERQVTRISCIDMNDDIVQIEFSGAGTLTVTLEGASGPATPQNYNQGVTYMKGHARITIAGANETTHVSVFSVGRITAVNQALFRDEVDYDGFADLASISIASDNGKFGGLRTANAGYSGVRGTIGIFAPSVEFTGPVFVGDISAFDDARPMLMLGSVAELKITGGDLFQPNGRAIAVSGIDPLQFADGSTSHGAILPAQSNRGRFEENGVDVTSQIVAEP